MILVDTSCWVDYLRGTGTPAAAEVDRLVREDLVSVATCEPIAMELLAGSGQQSVHDKIQTLVNGLPSLPFEPVTDFRTAAAIQRAARSRGLVVRSLVDCMIATVALRAGVPVLHKDADFEVIADLTRLQQISLR